ncbi:MAG TPA: hypothetical protein VEC37_14115 [Bacillota bacterium]|nr:hypothetical protein [Bacillota bacterium]
MKGKAWLCFISAILFVPLVLIQLSIINNPELKTFNLVLSLITTIIFVYIYVSFKNLLNSQFNYFAINRVVWFLVIIEVFLLLTDLFPSSPLIRFMIYVLGFLAGIAYIMMGIKLVKFEDRFNGFLKKYGYICIFQGVCMASIVLIFLSVLITLVEDIFLGLIFMQAEGEKPLSQNSNNSYS